MNTSGYRKQIKSEFERKRIVKTKFVDMASVYGGIRDSLIWFMVYMACQYVIR